ncbi:MAG: carbon starvation protein A, partial [Nitrospiraceae bacterium]
ILTTIDAGTRVARYLVQEMGGRAYAPLRSITWWPGVIVSSAAVVGAWGYLIGTGGISTIWPMFGAANQLLGMLALCVGTMVLIKMGKAKYLWVTAAPMLFVGVITLSGCYELFFLFAQKARASAESGQGLSLYVDAALVGTVAVLAVIILVDSIRQWYGYLIQGWPCTSSEVLIGAETVSASNPSSRKSGGIKLPTGRCC